MPNHVALEIVDITEWEDFPTEEQTHQEMLLASGDILEITKNLKITGPDNVEYWARGVFKVRIRVRHVQQDATHV